MDEQEILELSEEEIEKIERVNQSFTEREQAEAAKEKQKKFRVLFERASVEALPGIAYMVYVGYMGLIVLIRLLSYEGEKLWIGAFLLLIIVLAPILILPTGLFTKLRGLFSGRVDDED